MISKFILVITLFMSFNLWATTLTIHIQDVLDLATYQDVLKSDIELKEAQDNTFNLTIKSWNFYDQGQDFSIKVSGQAKYIDADTYYVSFKKVLFSKNSSVKVLVDEKFILVKQKQSFSVQDSYWSSSDLVVRQENVLKLK